MGRRAGRRRRIPEFFSDLLAFFRLQGEQAATTFSQLVTPPRDILERHGIDPRAMRDPDAYIDSKALVQLLEYCSRAFNDPLFGLRLGDFQDPDTFGAIATLCRSASSFREALGCFIDYIPVMHCPTVALELVEGPELTE